MYIPIFIKKIDGSKPTEEEIKKLSELMEQYESNGTHLIKDKRKIAGKTLREVAIKFNLTMSKLSAYEHNRDSIPQELLLQLEDYYAINTK